MALFDRLSKTLSTGVDRARFEADKFQRTSRISGDINNVKSQVDTNMRQLGERAMELYDQGQIDAPTISSLVQVIRQLQAQQTQKERELGEMQNDTFELWAARQPQIEPDLQQPPVGRSYDQASYDTSNTPPPSRDANPTYATRRIDDSDSISSVGDETGAQPAVDAPSNACANCGYTLPANALFCPNCGNRAAQA